MASRFITVSIEIMHNPNLTPNQKFILAEIEQLCSLEAGCIASNAHFSELIGIGKSGVSRAIGKLEVDNYISCEIMNGSRNMVRTITVLGSSHRNRGGSSHRNRGSSHRNRGSSHSQETKGNIHDNIHDNIHVATKVADHLLAKILSEKPNFKIPNIQAWARDIDLAIRIDKRTVEELTGCIDWIYSTGGSFWIPYILSGKKLREKFDVMESQMMSKKREKDSGYEALQRELYPQQGDYDAQ